MSPTVGPTRGARSRVTWALGDQVLSSATNFALTVAVARVATPTAFGLFATLLAGFIFILAVARGVTSDPFTTTYSAKPARQTYVAARACLGASLVIGLFVTVGATVGWLILRDVAYDALLIFALVAPGVLVQDAARFVLFARGRARDAFVNDAVWAVLQISGIVVLSEIGVTSAAAFLAVWGGAGTLCALLALLQCRLLPRLGQTRTWLREHWGLWKYYALENSLMNGTNLLVLLVIGLFAGLAGTAGLRVAVAVFGPFTILVLGVRAALVPEFVRLAQRDVHRMRRLARLTGLALAIAAVVWGALWMVLPDSWGFAMFGASWPLADRLLPYVTIDAVATMFMTAAFVGLRAVGAGQRGLQARLLLSPLRLVGALIGTLLGGARGAAISFAVLAPVQITVWSHHLDAAVQRYQPDQPCESH